MGRYKVRFASVQSPDSFDVNTASASIPTDDTHDNFSFGIACAPKTTKRRRYTRRKSRAGCTQCKLHHLKCDESFPVCVRCQISGSLCWSQPQLTKWQVEMPWLSGAGLPSYLSSPSTDKRLLKYWLEKASQIMTLDPDNNPMSFPILAHLAASPALVHALQSVSAAHEHFFTFTNLASAVEQRQDALRLVQLELQPASKTLPSTFLAVFLLGSFTSWIEGSFTEFGVQHLLGGRAIIDLLVATPEIYETAHLNYVVGCYIYWDACCSFIAEPNEIPALETVGVERVLQRMRDTFHPIGGFCMDIFFTIGKIGRYCRKVLAGEERDLAGEALLSKQLLQRQVPVQTAFESTLCEAYRKHGLIMLYRICGCLSFDSYHEGDAALFGFTTEEIIRGYSLEVLQDLASTPTTSHYFNLHGVPLLTAGSELDNSDGKLREEVLSRFKALFSLNRVPSSLVAIRLLQEVWALRDQSGRKYSWLEIMLKKGWRLKLG